MVAKIFVALLIFIGAVLVYVAVQPADFRIERSISVSAPANVAFNQVNDFHNWLGWSPWAKMDPKAVYTYGGPSSGVGSNFSWSGNKKVGVGKATITDSTPDSLIKIKLEFMAPFSATNMAEFDFKPDGTNTIVTWSMTGKNSFISKFFSVFFNMDKMVGGEFEKGLAAMKSISESQPQQPPSK